MSNLSHYCNICEEYISNFLPHGNPPRSNARCLKCDSLERHRFFKCWLDLNKSHFLPKSKILHFSPEKSLATIFTDIGKENYISVDIKKGKAMRVEDARSLSFQSESFDLIFCSHVIQHIREDQLSINELHRVLDKNGILILMGAFHDKDTQETSYINPSGEDTFIRIYKTSEFQRKLIECGFNVEIIFGKDIVPSSSDALKMGFKYSQFMFKCIKDSIRSS